MKMNGQEFPGRNKVTLVLPREGYEDIVIVAESIKDMSAFEKLVDAPKPPAQQGKGGVISYNHSDTKYLAAMAQYGVKRVAWMILTSLEGNGIEWETVDIKDPSTWLNYAAEFKEAGFSDHEVNLVGNAVIDANSLNEAKLEAAREAFLKGQ